MENKYRFLIQSSALSLLVLTLTACVETTSKSRSNISPSATAGGVAYGYYLDSAVEGLNYRCGKQAGTTDREGKFSYEAGKSCTISIGNIFLREIEPDILYPNGNVYETNPTVTRILQGLDMDGVLDNGIQVDNDIITAINQSYDAQLTDAERLKLLIDDLVDMGITLPDALEAKFHVINTILSNGLFRVNNQGIENLTFGTNGELKIEINGQVVSRKSYLLNPDGSIEISDDESIETYGIKEITSKYLILGPDTLWYSEKLAEISLGAIQNSPASGTHQLPPLDESKIEEYLDAINSARSVEQDCGTEGKMGPSEPLVWNDTLYRVAYEHSRDMGESNYFSHTGSGNENDLTATSLQLSGGSSSSQRVTSSGYLWSGTGENIAAGVYNAYDAVNLWIESDSHCANLMSPSLTEVGLSSYFSKKSDMGTYWTQVLAAPKQ